MGLPLNLSASACAWVSPVLKLERSSSSFAEMLPASNVMAAHRLHPWWEDAVMDDDSEPCLLVSEWRSLGERGDEETPFRKGYRAALRKCADELEYALGRRGQDVEVTPPGSL